MALDQESCRMICSDLAQLCRYETEKVVSGFTGFSAYRFREYAEQRLRMLPGLVKGMPGVWQSWYSDYVAIQDCIKQLDEYIRAQEVAQ